MQVRVLYFQSIQKSAGRAEESVALEAGATVKDLLDAVERERPELTPFRRSLLVAVNEEHAGGDRALHEGDCVALMPPFSGG